MLYLAMTRARARTHTHTHTLGLHSSMHQMQHTLDDVQRRLSHHEAATRHGVGDDSGLKSATMQASPPRGCERSLTQLRQSWRRVMTGDARPADTDTPAAKRQQQTAGRPTFDTTEVARAMSLTKSVSQSSPQPSPQAKASGEQRGHLSSPQPSPSTRAKASGEERGHLSVLRMQDTLDDDMDTLPSPEAGEG